MKILLGEEYDAFVSSYDDLPNVGLRVNTLKITPSEYHARSPFALRPLLWTSDGFQVLESETRPGLHPDHLAGLYYLQEPSAQVVAEILDPQPGERILDLAAAPGGKTTHIASKMQNQGLLIANEIHPKRVWDLTKNMERWGARNVIITHETPEHLAQALPQFFDRVLVDAPCSGEGMFRKTPEAIRDWSPEFVAGCAIRQTAILDTAAELVRPGGWLCYATCTFAPEENEYVIARFLDKHPNFELVSPSVKLGFIPTPLSLSSISTLSPQSPVTQPQTIRILPHRAPGEGHFIALLQRQTSSYRMNDDHLTMTDFSSTIQKLLPYWEAFASETLTLPLNRNQLRLVKSYLYHIPPETPNLSGLNLIRPGWWLGSFKKDRFEPSHALAMALHPEETRKNFSLDEPAALSYLHRDTLRFKPDEIPDGWTLITFQSFPIGWGKVVKGVIKNHYPAGLRLT